jgi:hypothetical protein
MSTTRAHITTRLFASAMLVLVGCGESGTSDGGSTNNDSVENTAASEETGSTQQTSAATTEEAPMIDPELCGDSSEKAGGQSSAGGLDLPTPEASVVTITGFDEDESIDKPNTRSNGGRYTVTLEEVGEIRVGEPFDIVATVRFDTGALAPMRVSATADAYMPRHFHGMNVTPETTRTGDGIYTTEGMVFHMTGLWEVYIDLSNLGVTERAQFEFEVE